jgi:tRNA G18 (ribose-2'-O)-methylase SpoU
VLAPVAVTSLDDPRIAIYRQIAHPSEIARAGLFVAEGRWVVQRLLARSRFITRSVMVTPTALAALSPTNGEGGTDRTVPTYVVEQTVMDQIVGFNIHRGCLAVAERPPVAVLSADTLSDARRVVVLEGVNNPDNIGGIFRSAAAFGVDVVVLGPACGDPLYRKAIRTSMAATLDVPYVASGAWPGALDIVRAAGLLVVALTPDAPAAIDTISPQQRLAFVLGTEGAGLTPGALTFTDVQLCIPMTGRVDSLNVTVAASIALQRAFST